MAQLVKTDQGLAIASVKTAQGLAIASVKTVDGVDNTSGGGPAITSISVLATATNDVGLELAPITATVTAGRAYVMWVGSETNGPLSITMTGANTGTMTAMTDAVNGTSTFGRFFHTLAMPNSGSTIFTGAAISGTAQYARLYLMEIPYTGGTAAADVDVATGVGTGTTATSGSFNTASAVEAVFAGVKCGNSRTFGTYLIAGSAATNGTAFGDSTIWWRSLTSTVSTQTASTVITGGSTAYSCPVFSFKVT